MKGLIEYYTYVYKNIPLLNTFNDDSRYVKVARYVNSSHLKLLTFLHVEKDVRSYVGNFVRFYQNVVMYPLIFGNTLLGFGFRSLKDRGHLILPSSPFTLYSSSYSISRFLLGYEIGINTPVFLTEGVLDAEFFGLLKHLSFSYLKSKLDCYQLQIISLCTRKVFICPDNDKAGKNSIRLTVRNFRKYGIEPGFINLPERYKDAGELLIACLERNPIALNDRALIESEIEFLKKGNSFYGKV